MTHFSDQERRYLRHQRLGRLATVDGRGAPQNSAVGFWVGEDDTILVGGRDLGNSRKFRNAERNPQVSFLVDDIASVEPWRVRAVEIRGTADTLRDVEPIRPGMSRERIVIHPERVIALGLGESDNA